MDSAIEFRFATEDDIPDILRLIKELARHVKSEEQVEATSELLKEWMFEKPVAEALLADHAHEGVIACAIFFQSFSTWTGQRGMYLEDLYVEQRHRASGTGRALVARLARICKERGLVRIDWSCLAWNTPSLGFYQSIGAEQLREDVHHRLSGEALTALSREDVL